MRFESRAIIVYNRWLRVSIKCTLTIAHVVKSRKNMFRWYTHNFRLPVTACMSTDRRQTGILCKQILLQKLGTVRMYVF